jgi:hypothetical protein
MASLERPAHTDQSDAEPPVGRPDPRDVRRRARRRRTRRDAPTALQTVASTFQMLTTGPEPICVDGSVVGHGLPRRPIPLNELRAILLRPRTRRECRDAAWQHLVAGARNQDPAWVVGAAGVALPALRKMARELAEGYRGDVTDLHSAVLTGFLEGLRRIDTGRPGVITRLRWAAYRAGIKARYTRDGIPTMPLPPLESQPPPNPWGHPDLVLLDAVAKGVLSPLQAELIGRSRLEDLTLKQAAAELGVGYEAACKARRRGEARLTAAISSGDVEHRLSAPARKSGLPKAGEHNPEPGVRGRSTASDGTSDGSHHGPDEEGAFCGPAHQPPPPTARPSTSDGPGASARRSGDHHRHHRTRSRRPVGGTS